MEDYKLAWEEQIKQLKFCLRNQNNLLFLRLFIATYTHRSLGIKIIFFLLTDTSKRRNIYKGERGTIVIKNGHDNREFCDSCRQLQTAVDSCMKELSLHCMSRGANCGACRLGGWAASNPPTGNSGTPPPHRWALKR